MKFSNVVAYCKGWYAQRSDNVDLMWMDLIHCIHEDGWYVCNKRDVAQWCIYRLDEIHEKENLKQLTFSWLISSIDKNRWLYHFNRSDGKKLSLEDSIIWMFYSFIRNLDDKYFTEGVRPSNKVLPFSLQDSVLSSFSKTFEFSEMMCDRLARIEETFPDYPEQVVSDNAFDQCESSIVGKNWQDVLVLPGTDSLLDCVETTITGNELNKATLINNNEHLDLNIYEHCKFDDNKKYLVRIKTNIRHKGKEWETVEHIVKSIREA